VFSRGAAGEEGRKIGVESLFLVCGKRQLLFWSFNRAFGDGERAEKGEGSKAGLR
jgi:hypothetical protein